MRLAIVRYAIHQRSRATMSKLFQIREDDLSELERLLPQFADVMIASLDNRLRLQFRRAQSIMSSVRWNYGPPCDVEVSQVEGDDE